MTAYFQGDLNAFCKHLVDKYGDPGSISEETKAAEFRQLYLPDLPLDPLSNEAQGTSLSDVQLSAYFCGINLKTLAGRRLPRHLRGYYDMVDGRKTVYYREGDPVSSIQNTILHEIREMMEHVFVEVCPTYVSLKTSAAHAAANLFASAVLLPGAGFLEQVYQSGFDVFALSQLYSKSCSQVLLRIGEVLQGQLFFYGALYEPHANNPDHWAVSYSTSSNAKSTNHSESCSVPDMGLISESMSGGSVNGFSFPRKGRAVKAGSLVDMTIKTAQAHLTHYAIRQNRLEPISLVIISQPLVLAQTTDKVAMIILLSENESLLRPQIEHLKPLVLE